MSAGFFGYASVFGEINQQNEIVAAGAFARPLVFWRRQNRLPAMLWMHDPTQPIGLWLSIKEDNNGLSIGYRVIASRIDAARKARGLTDVDLFEISLVTFPANEAERVDEVKTPYGETQTLIARLEKAVRVLRGKGFSSSRASSRLI
jgi:phage head maturation protease